MKWWPSLGLSRDFCPSQKIWKTLLTVGHSNSAPWLIEIHVRRFLCCRGQPWMTLSTSLWDILLDEGENETQKEREERLIGPDLRALFPGQPLRQFSVFTKKYLRDHKTKHNSMGCKSLLVIMLDSLKKMKCTMTAIPRSSFMAEICKFV